jgi:hypothetical protein
MHTKLPQDDVVTPDRYTVSHTLTVTLKSKARMHANDQYTVIEQEQKASLLPSANNLYSTYTVLYHFHGYVCSPCQSRRTRSLNIYKVASSRNENNNHQQSNLLFSSSEIIGYSRSPMRPRSRSCFYIVIFSILHSIVSFLLSSRTLVPPSYA